MTTYFKTQWLHPDPKTGWVRSSTFNDNLTREQAEDQLQRDINYFYSDIELRIVEVVETVVTSTKGSKERPTR